MRDVLNGSSGLKTRSLQCAEAVEGRGGPLGNAGSSLGRGSPSGYRLQALLTGSALVVACLAARLLAPQTNLLTFLQGPLGQCSPKPTTFLVSRLPGMASRLYGAYIPRWRATSWLGGKSSSGEWKTMQAKAYPSRLCQVMAEEFAQFYHASAEDGLEPLPAGAEALIAALSSWDAYMDDSVVTTMANDYHRGRQRR
eukprot:Skav222659  [mRNA]  locus=scaffold997:260550:261140:+ [translate_table: standard]